MGKILDLTGNRYGRLVVKEFAYVNKKNRGAYWNCVCDCGNYKVAYSGTLNNGHTQSCGCYQKECIRRVNKSRKGKPLTEDHKLKLSKASKGRKLKEYSPSYKPLSGIWTNINSRCYNSKNERYTNYGARGISMCEEWHDFNLFEQWFLENGWKSGLHTHRPNNDGNYEPGNVVFITPSEHSTLHNNIRWEDLNNAKK